MKTIIHLGAGTKVTCNEIVKLEAKENYTLIHFTNGRKLLSSTTLGVLEDRLKTHSFFRVNRSIMINLEYLDKFKIRKAKYSANALSSNCEEILVSRRRLADFEAKLRTCKN